MPAKPNVRQTKETGTIVNARSMADGAGATGAAVVSSDDVVESVVVVGFVVVSGAAIVVVDVLPDIKTVVLVKLPSLTKISFGDFITGRSPANGMDGLLAKGSGGGRGKFLVVAGCKGKGDFAPEFIGAELLRTVTLTPLF